MLVKFPHSIAAPIKGKGKGNSSSKMRPIRRLRIQGNLNAGRGGWLMTRKHPRTSNPFIGSDNRKNSRCSFIPRLAFTSCATYNAVHALTSNPSFCCFPNLMYTRTIIGGTGWPQGDTDWCWRSTGQRRIFVPCPPTVIQHIFSTDWGPISLVPQLARAHSWYSFVDGEE